MKQTLTACLLLLAMNVSAQSYENNFRRPLSDVLGDVAKRFHVRLKCEADTTGKILDFADYRIRPYSVEETLQNILSPFDFKAVRQNDHYFKIKRYEYPRRQAQDGRKLTAYLASLYGDRAQWERRRDTLKAEVRRRLGIDALLAKCSRSAMQMRKAVKRNGYKFQNFSLSTVNGHTICGTVYMPLSKGRHPLIICPIGHFNNGRYCPDLQKRYATLARMGAICVSYDLWGWGESKDEVGEAAHHTSEAHQMQTLHGLRILDEMLKRSDVDTQRVGINGGSGGGSQTVLLSLLDDRYTASCPTVSMSSWFDGGCPCESGMPIHLSGSGTCNMELAACFAPKDMMIVSDGGDWTSSTPDVEFPFLQRIYGFYEAKGKVRNVHLPLERHDFGVNKRSAVYTFFIDVFRLNGRLLDESLATVEDENVLRFNPKN